jgi:hypothetical protein
VGRPGRWLCSGSAAERAADPHVRLALRVLPVCGVGRHLVPAVAAGATRHAGESISSRVVLCLWRFWGEQRQLQRGNIVVGWESLHV